MKELMRWMRPLGAPRYAANAVAAAAMYALAPVYLVTGWIDDCASELK